MATRNRRRTSSQRPGAVVEVDSRQDAAAGTTLGQAYARTLGSLQWAAQDQLQSLLDQRRQCHTASRRFLPQTDRA